MTTYLLENYTTSFTDEAFLRERGGLTEANAIDYFALSPFYDAESNNELVRSQNKSLDVLKTLVGVEYALQKSGREPGLFIVVRQRRRSPHDAAVEAVYYIHEGLVVQAPDAYTLLQTRLFKASSSLAGSFLDLVPQRRFTSASGYRWKNTSGEDDDDDVVEDDDDGSSTRLIRSRIEDAVVFDALLALQQPQR